MEQTSCFDWMEDSDPIFVELQKLAQESSVDIPPFTITRNRYDLFELESSDVHDCCSTIEECYRYLCEYVSNK